MMLIGLAYLACGLLFGLGLALSGMTSPLKVLGFLDVAGAWNPALMLVLGSAVGVAGVAFHFILRRPRPVLGERFHVSGATRADLGLVLGSALFGMGWGICGYCPGPALALLAVPDNPETLPVLAGLGLGILISILTDRLYGPD
ncbi:DUF6691 family protein [Zoogloea sp.]|uniref:DUF6691 family protein n=1 Tax=Zoogloea sp. TaxID=49181 RepID=UPI003F679BF1